MIALNGEVCSLVLKLVADAPSRQCEIVFSPHAGIGKSLTGPLQMNDPLRPFLAFVGGANESVTKGSRQILLPR